MNEPPFDVNITDEYGQLNFSRGMPKVDENTSKGTIIGKVVAMDYDTNDMRRFPWTMTLANISLWERHRASQKLACRYTCGTVRWLDV